jgi:hypothetical protein
MERCATGILVVGDVLEHCLVVNCVLGGAFGDVYDYKFFALV